MKIIITENQLKSIILKEQEEKSEGSYIKGISDADIIAATIVGEARGEGKDGMTAIKNVIDNRAYKRNSSAAGESIRPKQFSMWNTATSGVSVKKDFDTSKLKSIIEKYKKYGAWEYAHQIAGLSTTDTTDGSTLYYSLLKYKDLDNPRDGDEEKKDPPYWTKTWEPTIVIGNHKFGK
jgi:hypothetical protein